MKPYDLSQYMYQTSLATGAGLMGFAQTNTYAPGTIGEALKNLGAAGPGAGGSGVVTTEYMYNANTVAAPAIGEIRFDTAAPNAATNMKVSQTTAGGVDVGLAYSYLAPGQRVYIQQKDDATRYVKATVVGTPVDQGNWWLFPILVTGDSGVPLTEVRCILGWPASAASGSGTPANVIPKGGTAGGFLNSQFFDDGINVGLGTGTPASKLHVKGSGLVVRMETATARGLGQDSLAFYDPSGIKGYLGYNSDDKLWLNNVLGNDLGLAAGNAEQMTILAAGGVAFPSLTPGSVLFAGVSGKLSQDNVNFFFDDTNNRLGVGVSLPQAPIHAKGSGKLAHWETTTARGSTGQCWQSFFDPTGQKGFIGYVADDTFQISQQIATSNMVFLTADQPRLVIRPAGNVGIGTANPQALLDVDAGFIQTGRYGGAGGAVIIRTAQGTQASPTQITAQTQTGGIVFRGYDGAVDRDTASINSWSDGAITNTSSPGLLIFATTPAGAVGSQERMRIGSGGETGIGTVPMAGISSRLQVLGDLSLFASGGQLVAFNAYYSGGWKARNPGYSSALRLDSNAGILSMYISSTSAAADFAAIPNFQEAFRVDYAMQAHVYGQAIWLNTEKAIIQHDNTNLYVRPQTNGNTYLGANGNNYVALYINTFYPTVDNAALLGQAAQRWLNLYVVNAPIVGSDGREKQWRGGLTPEELAAAKEIAKSVGIFQRLDAIAKDGVDKAPLHVGVVAQTVVAAMAAQGLDALRYGFVVYDKWEASEQPTGPDNAMVPVPAGDRFGVRYEELAMFLAAAQEQRLAALEAR